MGITVFWTFLSLSLGPRQMYTYILEVFSHVSPVETWFSGKQNKTKKHYMDI